MTKAVIVGYSRSPFTIANKGDLISIRPEDLLSEVLSIIALKFRYGLLKRDNLFFVGGLQYSFLVYFLIKFCSN